MILFNLEMLYICRYVYRREILQLIVTYFEKVHLKFDSIKVSVNPPSLPKKVVNKIF